VADETNGIETAILDEAGLNPKQIALLRLAHKMKRLANESEECKVTLDEHGKAIEKHSIFILEIKAAPELLDSFKEYRTKVKLMWTGIGVALAAGVGALIKTIMSRGGG